MSDREVPPSALWVQLDELFAFDLVAEASAGYEWIPILDPEAICYLGHQQLAISGSGASAHVERRMTFRALKVGAYRLRLLYKRRWETVVRDELNVIVHVELGAAAG